MKGHVVVTFNVHKDGSITEIDVPGPCPVQAFNRAAQGALDLLEPDAAAAARVPGRSLLLHGHVLLQRDAAVSLTGLRPES